MTDAEEAAAEREAIQDEATYRLCHVCDRFKQEGIGQPWICDDCRTARVLRDLPARSKSEG
jgi:hypothetical protein